MLILKLEQDLTKEDVEIFIKYAIMNQDIERLVSLIQSVNIRIKCDFNGTEKLVNASEIAVNAKSKSIYVNPVELSEVMGILAGSYNGILSMEQAPSGGITIEKAKRINDLKRSAVSNNTSAVINQVIGSVVGCILIFLALYVNFQDNTRDMLILHLMGYRPKEIRKMLIDVYKPIVCIFSLITIIPSIFIARFIQRSLSITTNDYMPFGTSIVVILLVFVLLNIIYWLVQTVFSVGIKRTIKKETNL